MHHDPSTGRRGASGDVGGVQCLLLLLRLPQLLEVWMAQSLDEGTRCKVGQFSGSMGPSSVEQDASMMFVSDRLSSVESKHLDCSPL